MIKRVFFGFFLPMLLSGCLSFNFGVGGNSAGGGHPSEGVGEIVLVANSNNVYRIASDVALDVKVQNARGKWVKSEHKVLVPEDWFIVDKNALD